MSDKTESGASAVLDAETLNILGAAPAAAELSPQTLDSLRQRIGAKIDASRSDHITIRDGDGQWLELLPGIKKKTLFSDPQRGAETYLIRAQPGAVLPAHGHSGDEHCLVLEGEVGYGDTIRLYSGDFHLARSGSEHQAAHTTTGALVYIQVVPPM